MRDPLGRPPIVLILPAAIGTAVIVVPLISLIARTPWTTLVEQLSSPSIGQALWLSVLTSTISMAIVTVVGLPMAWLLARLGWCCRPSWPGSPFSAPSGEPA